MQTWATLPSKLGYIFLSLVQWEAWVFADYVYSFCNMTGLQAACFRQASAFYYDGFTKFQLRNLPIQWKLLPNVALSSHPGGSSSSLSVSGWAKADI